MMNSGLIENKVEYEWTLRRVGELMDALNDTLEGEELNRLCGLVEIYENKECSIGMPDPIEAIKFRMDQAGLKQKDLAPFIGCISKVSEVLSGKRPLSINMIRSLSKNLGISMEVLAQKTQHESK